MPWSSVDELAELFPLCAGVQLHMFVNKLCMFVYNPTQVITSWLNSLAIRPNVHLGFFAIMFCQNWNHSVIVDFIEVVDGFETRPR